MHRITNGLPTKGLESEHVLIAGASVLLSPELRVEIGFGQPDNALVMKGTKIRNGTERLVVNNSRAGAVNFMSGMGYGFVGPYDD